MLLQVHDELLFEAPEAEAETLAALAKRVMENAAVLSVPLVVETGVGGPGGRRISRRPRPLWGLCCNRMAPVLRHKMPVQGLSPLKINALRWICKTSPLPHYRVDRVKAGA